MTVSGAMPAAPPRRLLVPALVTLVGIAVLVGLGTWQLERKAWKDALVATLGTRLAAAPEGLPPVAAWAGLTPADAEFRRVAFRAAFTGAKEAPLYTAGSALRSDVKGPGQFIFAPARLPDGSTVVVNRGFVPGSANGVPAGQGAAAETGPVDLVGVLRWPEAPGWFVGEHDPRSGLWFARNHRAMAQQNGWGEVAPFYLDLESPTPPGGLPRPGRLSVQLSNNHLQYALTWYSLALVLAVVFAVWARSKPAAGAGPAPASVSGRQEG